MKRAVYSLQMRRLLLQQGIAHAETVYGKNIVSTRKTRRSTVKSLDCDFRFKSKAGWGVEMNGKKHFSKFVGLRVGIAAVGVTVLRVLRIEETTPYSDRWFSKASDEELKQEREKVRLRHCSGDAEATRLLRVFDNELLHRERKDHDDRDFVYPPHREHGWYLPNDD